MSLCHSNCEEFDNSEVGGNGPHKRPPSLLTLIASVGVPKITLGFDNSLEGLTELTESYYAHGYVLLQGEDTDWNPLREKSA